MLLTILSNPFKFLCLVLSILSLYFYISTVKLERDNKTLTSNITNLKQSIYSQDKTIEFLQSNQRNINKTLDDLVVKNNSVNDKLTESIKEISLLRSTESRKSYEQPYQRGIFNTDMLTKRLQSITRETDTSTEQVSTP